MVLASEKIFYYHIPRTGGTAIEKFLLEYYNYKPFNLTTFTYGLIQWYATNGSSWAVQSIAHLPFTEIVELSERSKIQIDNSWDIFTLVRDPYQRITSAILFQFLANQEMPDELYKQRSLFSKAQKQFFSTDPNRNEWFNHRVPQSTLLDVQVDQHRVNVYKYEDSLEAALTSQFNNRVTLPEYLPKVNDYYFENNKPKVEYIYLWDRSFIETVNSLYFEDFKRFNYSMLDPKAFPPSW